MPASYRVRFAKSHQTIFNPSAPVAPAPRQQNTRNNTKSRTGCRQCKLRRVKCDEQYPVCRRCEQRGTICLASPLTSTNWQLEMPWLTIDGLSLGHDAGLGLTDSDQNRTGDGNITSLLQYWFEKADQIMVIFPPSPDAESSAKKGKPVSISWSWSYPLLCHLAHSNSLLHGILSLSAAHEYFFLTRAPTRARARAGGISYGFVTALAHRGRALSELQCELRQLNIQAAGPSRGSESHVSSALPLFFTILLLGWCTPWIDQDMTRFGEEHLLGARAIVDNMLEKEQQLQQHERRQIPDTARSDDTSSSTSLHIILGYYIYWDMSVSFMVEETAITPLDTPQMARYIELYECLYHPAAGYSLRLFYILGNLHRYCRRIMQGGHVAGDRESLLEQSFEEQLTAWTTADPDGDPGPGPIADSASSSLVGETFRRHGLIMLRLLCRCSYPTNTMLAGTDMHADVQKAEDEVDRAGALTLHNSIIRQQALDMLGLIRRVPVSSTYFAIQSIPLLTAGSELGRDDGMERAEVLRRFKALYSLSRCHVHLWACDLLEENWRIRDGGDELISLYTLMLRKGYKWSMA